MVQVREQARKKLVVLATKEAHVLGDLLVRCAYDDLPADILAVCSNHEVLAPLVKGFGLPFHFISSEHRERQEHEQLVLDCLDHYKFDYLVLAKYMRVLNPNFVAHFPNRVIFRVTINKFVDCFLTDHRLAIFSSSLRDNLRSPSSTLMFYNFFLAGVQKNSLPSAF